MEKLSINRKSPVQENFLGLNAVYHGFAGMPDDAGREYSEEQCELEADLIKKMGVKIVRTRYQWWAWTREEGWNWENDMMCAFYRWCERMQKRGIEIAIQGGWCSPGDINNTSWGGDGPFADNGVSFETACENFAAWVSESLHQLIEVRGFTNIKYVMLFTEAHKSAGKVPEGYTDFSVWEKASRTIHEKLVADGRRNLVKLVGPNENARGYREPAMLSYAVENASDFLDYYGCHIYSRAEIEEGPSAVRTGKRAFCFTKPGHRVGQIVTLKPNTNYEATAYIHVFAKEYLRLSGNVLLGAFSIPDDDNGPLGRHTFSAGGDPTTRFHLKSVGMTDPIPFGDDWVKVSHKFNSEQGGECIFGMFYDVRGAEIAYADDFSLVEEGTEENIIKNPSFEYESSVWQGGTSIAMAYDVFDDWYMWGKTMMDMIPKNQGLVYDECNSVHKAQNGYYTDPMHGVRYATANIGLMNAGVNTSMIWSAFDQLWPQSHVNNNDSFTDGVQHCGLMPILHESCTPRPGYYAFALMANLVGGEGTKVYAESECGVRLHSVLTERPDGNVTVAITSLRDYDTEFSLQLGKATEKPLYRYVYNPETIKPDERAAFIESDKVLSADISEITDTIPANCFIVYSTAKL